jgi:indole-3-glycerol phosphate synthase
MMRAWSSLLVTSLCVPNVAGGYTPPGVLAQLVEEKRREVDRLRSLPEAREDGPWSLRLGYPATSSSYNLGRALGWKRGRPAVLCDIKRTSPTGELGRTVPIAPDLAVSSMLSEVSRLGVDGAMICTDLASYGGSVADLKDANAYVQGSRAAGPSSSRSPMPIVVKDLVVDPLQIARAACEGATAVVLIAAAVMPDLKELMDTCTLLGLEALVEVHTPQEVEVATELGAMMLLVNERDRATGQLVLGQAAGMAAMLPPDATCLACGGISRLDQVRTLRRAGYDGFVIGRALLGDPRDAEALMTAIAREPEEQRWTEIVEVPTKSREVQPPGGVGSIFEAPIVDDTTFLA